MADYKKMYLKLFNAISTVIELLQKGSLAAEEIYISSEEVIIDIIGFKQEKDGKEEEEA